MDKILLDKINFKIQEIDRLFKEYELVFEKVNTQEIDLFDMTVLGSVLHSFYNGLENIFEIIAKNIDGSLPSGNKSHQQLLQQMNTTNTIRSEVITSETFNLLKEYATFRHFYRHAYSFQLNWEKMKPLVDNIFTTWEKVKQDLIAFIKN